MKVNFDAEILDVKGKQVTLAAAGAGDGTDPLTLRRVAENTLLTQFNDDQALSRAEKLSRYRLFVKINGGATELDVDEAKMLKDCIGKYQPILIMGRCFDIIESGAAATDS